MRSTDRAWARARAQWGSVIEQPRGEHSAKPEAVLELIEPYFLILPQVVTVTALSWKG